MKKSIIVALSLSTFLAACVNPERVNTTQANDAALSCADINAQFSKIAAIKAEAAKGTGLSGQNVAAALLFWPAAAGNYMNGSEAIKAADARHAVLTNLATAKKCK